MAKNPRGGISKTVRVSTRVLACDFADSDAYFTLSFLACKCYLNHEDD